MSSYAFIVFVLLYMPCVVVAIAMKQEFGTWKWFGMAFAYQMVLAWTVAFVISSTSLPLSRSRNETNIFLEKPFFAESRNI